MARTRKSELREALDAARSAPNPESVFLTRSQVAEMLGRSERSIDRMRATGEIASVQLSPRAIRFRLSTVLAFIDARETPSHSGGSGPKPRLAAA